MLYLVKIYGCPNGYNEMISIEGLVNNHAEFIAFAMEVFDKKRCNLIPTAKKDEHGAGSLSFDCAENNNDFVELVCEPIGFIKVTERNLIEINFEQLKEKITPQDMLQIKDCIKKGQKLEAIKYLKSSFNLKGFDLSLKYAKQYVDGFDEFLKLSPIK
jgi:hypothetical protein